ncbi:MULTISPECIES: hypothetical protein [Bacteroidales]|uniref:hypothetical protein n=1 Tax=Bacteroidales TaxID=171549 RepID=UPI00359F58A1
MTTGQLLKVLEREDYKRVSNRVSDAAEKLEGIIRAKMNILEMSEIKVNGHNYIVSKVRSNSGYGEECLARYKSREEQCEWIGWQSHYFAGDFHCWIEGAKTRTEIEFVNDAKALLQELDKIETELTKKAEEALESVKDIIE